MIILGIETSCDDTAICIVDADGDFRSGKTEYKVLGNNVNSQEIHSQYGGVYPNMAKREHSKNLIPALTAVLESSFCKLKVKSSKFKVSDNARSEILKILEREQDLSNKFFEYIESIEKPEIDAIALTVGPGLEPCLWTGISFAKALSLLWNIPIIQVNHMEGHIFSSLLERKEDYPKHKVQSAQKLEGSSNVTCYMLHVPIFPAISLLISGGHTQLVLIKDWFDYEVIGNTKDDAVGEAFDKVARIMGLPYPGGPHISRLAEMSQKNADQTQIDAEKDPQRFAIKLPRPMLKSGDFDFSFSGLKTSVLYLLKKINGIPLAEDTAIPKIEPELQSIIAKEVEDAITEVLVSKTQSAIEKYDAKALLVGGGVSADKFIKSGLTKMAESFEIDVHFPERELRTDNALMIALAGYIRHSGKRETNREMKAQGNLKLDLT